MLMILFTYMLMILFMILFCIQMADYVLFLSKADLDGYMFDLPMHFREAGGTIWI